MQTSLVDYLPAAPLAIGRKHVVQSHLDNDRDRPHYFFSSLSATSLLAIFFANSSYNQSIRTASLPPTEPPSAYDVFTLNW